MLEQKELADGNAWSSSVRAGSVAKNQAARSVATSSTDGRQRSSTVSPAVARSTNRQSRESLFLRNVRTTKSLSKSVRLMTPENLARTSEQRSIDSDRVLGCKFGLVFPRAKRGRGRNQNP